MQVSNNGIDYRIVDGGTTIIDNLPAKVFDVRYHQMFGTWLSERKELHVGDFKIYGNTPKRVNKVFTTFGKRDKNLGILLSGDKGMGKSVFMRYVAEEAIKRNLPVIVINSDIPGLADFISKIDQECVILFDEFEKNFLKDGERDGDEQGGQTQFLSLFDGTDSGKKLFMIAINNSRKLSEFFINRPGRFYYHFKFNYLEEDEVREYSTDNLKDEYKSNVDKLVLISKFHDMNYDILSAIVCEINNGYTLKETLNDLNIDISENQKYYDVETVVDGIKLCGSVWVDADDDSCEVYLRTEGSRKNNLNLSFDMSAAKFVKSIDSFVITGDGINWVNVYSNFGKYEIGNNEDVVIDKIFLKPHKWDKETTLSYLI